MGSFETPCKVCGEIGRHSYEVPKRKGFTRRQLFSPIVAGYIDYQPKGKLWEGTGRMLVLRHLSRPAAIRTIDGSVYDYASIEIARHTDKSLEVSLVTNDYGGPA